MVFGQCGPTWVYSLVCWQLHELQASRSDSDQPTQASSRPGRQSQAGAEFCGDRCRSSQVTFVLIIWTDENKLGNTSIYIKAKWKESCSGTGGTGTVESKCSTSVPTVQLSFSSTESHPCPCSRPKHKWSRPYPRHRSLRWWWYLRTVDSDSATGLGHNGRASGVWINWTIQ